MRKITNAAARRAPQSIIWRLLAILRSAGGHISATDGYKSVWRKL
jgi:hypothetical protein